MKQLVILLLLFALPGCGIFRKFKDKHELEIKADVVQTVGTTTTEKVDTLIPIKAKKVKVTRPLQEVLEGTPIIATDGPNSVEIKYNKDTKSITAIGSTEAHDVPVVIDRTIQESVQTVDRTATKQNDVVLKTERKTSSGFTFGFMLAVVILLALIILLFWMNRKF